MSKPKNPSRPSAALLIIIAITVYFCCCYTVPDPYTMTQQSGGLLFNEQGDLQSEVSESDQSDISNMSYRKVQMVRDLMRDMDDLEREYSTTLLTSAVGGSSAGAGGASASGGGTTGGVGTGAGATEQAGGASGGAAGEQQAGAAARRGLQRLRDLLGRSPLGEAGSSRPRRMPRRGGAVAAARGGRDANGKDGGPGEEEGAGSSGAASRAASEDGEDAWADHNASRTKIPSEILSLGETSAYASRRESRAETGSRRESGRPETS